MEWLTVLGECSSSEHRSRWLMTSKNQDPSARHSVVRAFGGVQRTKMWTRTLHAPFNVDTSIYNIATKNYGCRYKPPQHQSQHAVCAPLWLLTPVPEPGKKPVHIPGNTCTAHWCHLGFCTCTSFWYWLNLMNKQVLLVSNTG